MSFLQNLAHSNPNPARRIPQLMMVGLWSLLACQSSEPVSTVNSLSHRITIDTQHLWNMEPWKMDPAPSLPTIQMQATVDIEENWSIEGASMTLSGLWWQGQLTINGTPLPMFYGGNHSIEIPLTGLQYGKNTFSLQIQAPKDISRRVTGGTLSSLDRKGSTAMVSEPPKIHLRPKDHISGLMIDVMQRQDQTIQPVAWIQGDGNTVHFEVTRDGETLADLGSCPLSNGQTQCEKIPWPLKRWNVGNPNLYFLQATMLDGSGEKLDVHSARIGVRSVSWNQNSLTVNDSPTTLMATRMVYRHQGQSFQERIPKYTTAGVNSIETHGEWIRQDWLGLADEMGLGTVIVPRCVGRTNDRQGGSEQHLAEHMTLQDQRLMWDIKDHPTVLAFALEGDTSNNWSNRSLWTDTLVNNPQNLPVFGKDLPVRLFQVEYKPDNSYTGNCRPNGCGSSWLVETVTQPKFVDWSSIAKSYAQAHQGGSKALGGVIPSPRQSGGKRQPDNPAELEEWTAAWQEAANTIEPTPLASTNRASSDITVTSTANTWIELQVPGQTPLRKRTDEKGQAQFWVFHEGRATILCPNGEQQIEIKADAWVDFIHQSNNTPLSCN